MTLSILSVAFALCCAVVAWRVWIDDRRRSAARVSALASAIGAHGGDSGSARAAEPVAVASLFNTSAPVNRTRQWGQAAAVALLVGALAGVTFALRRPAPAGPAESATQPTPLELTSMRHVNRGSALMVTGLVRNPSTGSALNRVDAVVLAFDRDGGFVMSGEAPLSVPVLHPGEESPFSVTLRDAADVSRYRVSFRTGEGPIRHVDQRTGGQLAAARP